jgi:hypothetical protein
MLAPTRPDVHGGREASYRTPPQIPYVAFDRFPALVVLSDRTTLHRYEGRPVWRVERTDYRGRKALTLVLVTLEHSGDVVELRAWLLPPVSMIAMAPIAASILTDPGVLGAVALAVGSAVLSTAHYVMTWSDQRRARQEAFDAIEDTLADMDGDAGDQRARSDADATPPLG